MSQILDDAELIALVNRLRLMLEAREAVDEACGKLRDALAACLRDVENEE